MGRESWGGSSGVGVLGWEFGVGVWEWGFGGGGLGAGGGHHNINIKSCDLEVRHCFVSN